MTDRYVDALIGAASDYDPVNRAATGGGMNSYATLQAAFNASISTVDTVYVREGDNPLGASFGWGKVVNLYRYQKEDAWIVGVADVNGIQLVSAGSGSRFDIKFKDGGGLQDKRAIFFNGMTDAVFERLEIKNWKGAAIFHSGASDNNLIKQLIVEDLPDTGSSGKSIGLFTNATSGLGRLTIEVAKFKNCFGNAIRVGQTLDDIYIGQLLVDSCNADGFASFIGDINVTNGTLEVANILHINTGKHTLSTYALRRNSGTLKLNEGIVNGNIGRPNTHLVSGTGVDFGNVIQNGYVEFENDNADSGCVSFIAIDSNWLDTNPASPPSPYPIDRGAEGTFLTASEDIINSFNVADAKMTFLPDDQRTWVQVGKDTYAQNAVSAGMEMGCEGESSSPMDELNPLNVVYVGAATVATLSISLYGTLATLDIDGVNTTFDLTVDSSRTGDDYNAPFIGNASTSGEHLYQQLELVSGITCAINGDSASWDDTPSSILEDGAYDIKAGAKDISMNRERYFVIDIDETQSQTLALSGANPVSYYQALYTGGEADVAARLSSVGIKCAIGGQNTSDESQLNFSASDGFDIYNLTARKDDYLGTGQTQIEATADVVATSARTNGEWAIFVLPSLGNARPSEEYKWFIDRLKLRGVPIKTLSEGADYYNNKLDGDTVLIQDNRTDELSSASSGTGKKWWTGASPTGLNGEPFSDFDTDACSVQSTNSPFHPVNL